MGEISKGDIAFSMCGYVGEWIDGLIDVTYQLYVKCLWRYVTMLIY